LIVVHEVGGLDVLKHALAGLQVTTAGTKTAGSPSSLSASLPASSTTNPRATRSSKSSSSPHKPGGALDAPHLVALVPAGAWFEKGTLVERPDEKPGSDQQVA
jgi:hypothetical protein